MPALDAKPLLAELRNRVAEEFDYRLEAAAQKGFATAYAGTRTSASHAWSPSATTCSSANGLTASAGQDHRRGHGRSAEPGGRHDYPFPVLGSCAGQAPARGSAPWQLLPPCRRAARRARLRRCRPATRRLPAVLLPTHPSGIGIWPGRCSASSNAKHPSALKCCDGYPDTWTRPSPGRSRSPRSSQRAPGRLPRPDPRRQPPPAAMPDPRRRRGRRSRKGPCRRPEWSRRKGWLSLCG